MILYTLGYVSLLSQSSLEITFGGYSEMGKHTIGYNIEFFNNYVQCPDFVSLELGCALVNNINLTFGFMVILILSLLSMTLYSKFRNYQAKRVFEEDR